MNAQEYRSLREAIGTRLAVAKHLGISESTLDRRERVGAGRKSINDKLSSIPEGITGKQSERWQKAARITREAEIAMKAMHASGLKLNGKRKPRRVGSLLAASSVRA
jgi:hypothetical protein